MSAKIGIGQLAFRLAFSNAITRLAFEQNKIDLMLNSINKFFVEDGSFPPQRAATTILQICKFMNINTQEIHSIYNSHWNQFDSNNRLHKFDEPNN